MNLLIDDFESRYLLGIADMDRTHQEFVELVNRLGSADKPEFIQLFDQLELHTQNHFTAENALMQQTGFPAIREHMDEHQRVLGDLQRIGQRVVSGRTALGRDYVTQHLPLWFDLHAKTMDSALAAHLKGWM